MKWNNMKMDFLSLGRRIAEAEMQVFLAQVIRW